MSTSQPIDLETLLSQHSNDPTKALLHLISRHNDLIRTHSASLQENSKLWTTLRASSSRQNLEGLPVVKENGGHSTISRGGGGGGSSTSNSSNGLSSSIRKSPFLESTSGSPQLLLPSKDLSTSPNQHSSSFPIHSNRDGFTSSTQNQLPLPDSNGFLRKGASLDLIRPSYRERELSPNRSPQLISSTSSVRSASDLSSSASMPVLNNHHDDLISTFLPPIIPGSPLDFINSSASKTSPLPSPSPSSPDATSSNSNSNSSSQQIHPETPAVAAQTLYESLPLPSFPTSPLPLSPPPSSSESLSDPLFEKQQNSIPIEHSTVPPPTTTVPNTSTTSLEPIHQPTLLPPRSPNRPILSPSSLPFCFLRVGSSNLSLTEKGKETVSFIIEINILIKNSVTGEVNTTGWKVEKLFSEIIKLDSLVRSKINRQELKNLRPLPDKTLFKDHSPHKSDQRKIILERYFQGLTVITSVDNMIICAFFNSDLVVDNPVNSSTGVMEGWLSKRGRNFGGWQTRYYLLSLGSLSYYDTRDGVKLGEINISQASIGRQSSRSTDITTDDTYLHAFLIRTVRTSDDKDQDADHILCAESDEFRDAWVNALTSLQTLPLTRTISNTSNSNNLTSNLNINSISRPNLPSLPSFEVPVNQLRSPEAAENRRHNRKQSIDSLHDSFDHQLGHGYNLHSSTSSSQQQQQQHSNSRRAASSDLPLGSTSSSTNNSNHIGIENLQEKRSTSELGYHPTHSISRGSAPPSSQFRPPQNNDRPITPEPLKRDKDGITKIVASNVSGPMNANPINGAFKTDNSSTRSKKTKSSFWNFSRGNTANVEKLPTPAAPPPPSRPVFGVPLKEAVAISRIRPGLELPAIVYRCVEYLEAKNAEQEEGIYRLSGSSSAIKALKDRFNSESDVNLLASPAYHDCHCIAGLLKLYFRELPVHILTRELHPEFIKVIELRERDDRVQALARLVARLPIENYTCFRFFFAHLCVIAQSEVSKMGLRNLGIVFSPTLAMPAPLFSLLLSEFDTIFSLEKANTPTTITVEGEHQPSRPRPNSVIYTSNADFEPESSNRLLPPDEEDEENQTLEDSGVEDQVSQVHDIQSQASHQHQSTSSNSNSMNPPSTPRSTVSIPSSPRPGKNFFTS